MRGGTSALLHALTFSGAVWMCTPAEALPIQKSVQLGSFDKVVPSREVVSESLAPSFAVTETHSSVQSPSKQETQLCAISSEGKPCRNRQLHTDNGYFIGASCPKSACCSKTMCGPGGCGEFCSSNWIFCSSSLIYHPDKSYGGDCSCEKQGHRCDKNAECVENLDAGGGVHCKCKDGFVGTGLTCSEDPCSKRGNAKCGPNGTCIVVDSVSYTCTCGDGETLVNLPEGGQGCKRTGCHAFRENCSPGRCIDDASHENGYTCECPTGYSREVTSKAEESCVEGVEVTLAEKCEKEFGISASSCKCDNGYSGSASATSHHGKGESGSEGSLSEKMNIVFKCPSGYHPRYHAHTVTCEKIKHFALDGAGNHDTTTYVARRRYPASL
ncbi:microneme protein MIC3 [Toxoplasma gondii TgCatPRC2]|uniref:Micronemal protein 3 n=9 Tax=Toxoplasma gondii TaxID=5811 RepID=MIC3_TOXGO|nr:microneme protein MIC3 [Toxoplasma gondii ME49]EPR58134.1 microneme protein MIC3 [Toxoplasma gondii GT1]KAF4644940.1 microneme protein MIC3 [Toxoplasma gondii]KFH11451.1 microneme protein MIC3 [Toxoplasma gondii MAS]KYF39118.1 microneme protein MIC3 [Toxoplasma gondii ARI]KYK66872.1 microneme protein MIC3 [Toxoplasma gondii TgCatPRC2]PIL97462.1 microneme protein MIC3 [Toxoplasma gondii COUG]RQX67638.1 microneme protein MIC3 [Toxoplasma gondii CAST]|eukprot:XP_018638028.1 microneme protein MIC3 [Toxoplasma gondii ME49]